MTEISKNKTYVPVINQWLEKKRHTEIMGDFIEEWTRTKILRSSFKISMHILDWFTRSHVKPSLRKEPDQIIIHDATNDVPMTLRMFRKLQN